MHSTCSGSWTRRLLRSILHPRSKAQCVYFQKQLTQGDVVKSDGRFSELAKALEKSRGLRDDLDKRTSKLTLFAPTNEAMKKLKEGMRSRRSEYELDEILRYHVGLDDIKRQDLYEGLTIVSDLKLNSLDGNYQRIRVFETNDQIMLNMYAKVLPNEVEAENGWVFALDDVLIPPPRIRETLMYLPTQFSTFMLACYRTGILKHLGNDKAITVFVPQNHAWEGLGIRKLMYLFSDEGKEDLRKIVEYHLSSQLVYADKLIKQKDISLSTELKGEHIRIRVEPHNQRRGSRSLKDDKRSPSEYNFSLNDGASVLTFTDGVAANGNIFLISDVLVPRSVKLPDEDEDGEASRW